MMTSKTNQMNLNIADSYATLSPTDSLDKPLFTPIIPFGKLFTEGQWINLIALTGSCFGLSFLGDQHAKETRNFPVKGHLSTLT